MARQKKPEQRDIEQYEHKNKQRVNNPPIGLVNPDTDPEDDAKKYAYDLHLDPQLVWAGKAECSSFDVPTVSLHVHERIDPHTIIKAVQKHKEEKIKQLSLFQTLEENPPIRQAIEFYKHKHNWTNRLVAGDSLLVMNSLLEKEGMAGQVQMIYIDPPYGIKYGSNFQPFVDKREVKDGKDEDLTQEPEMIKAFRDTWELGIHSYLSYLRDRLLLARELLSESGSIFVQISDDNVHNVRILMDEVFGANNFISLISYATTGGFETSTLSRIGDYIIWYSKSQKFECYQLFLEKKLTILKSGDYRYLEEIDGSRRLMTQKEKEGEESLPQGSRIFRLDNTTSQGAASEAQPFKFDDKTYEPRSGNHWKAKYPEGMERLKLAQRFYGREGSLAYIRYLNDFPVIRLTNMWTDTSVAGTPEGKLFVVQTNPKVIERCLLMTTAPGDLVLDITCGSGTTAYVAEQRGRRWITCDTSRVAITLAKQRLMTASFDYYQLAIPEDGVNGKFKYKTVPHITLESIANNPEIREGMTREQIEKAIHKYAKQEVLYDQPIVDKSKIRITGPFTVEAVPAPTVKPLDDIEGFADTPIADRSISRSGETLRQAEWRDELLKTGIRGKGGQYILFSRVESLPGTRWLHADAETKPSNQEDNNRLGNSTEEKPIRAVISFGLEHAPLDQRQVGMAIEEAQTLIPKPKLVIFAAFQFDPEAAKDIDETNWPGVTLLKVQMNADLLTEDLKKKRASNESFWLIGQPDVALRRIHRGEDIGKWEVQVHGFDYYNTKTGNIESGTVEKIAMWMLDTDYDGRSIFPCQVFFPMAGEKDGWFRLAKNLKAEIDEDLIESYQGTVSLPFKMGSYQRIAVKIVDDRGIESLKIIRLT